MKEIKHFINGEFVGSASGRTFDDINPATGQVIAKVHEGITNGPVSTHSIRPAATWTRY